MMSHFEVTELRSAVTTLKSQTQRLNQAADALLRKFETIEGLAFTEFDQSLAATSGWNALAETIGATGLQVSEQAVRLQHCGARLLEPFDKARTDKVEADTDSSERAVRAAAYASEETNTKTEADALRERLRKGEKLSAPERDRANELGVLLPHTEKRPTTRW